MPHSFVPMTRVNRQPAKKDDADDKAIQAQYNAISERHGRRRLMDLIKVLLAPFAVNTGNPELLRAQLKVFSKQVPLLYLILTVNTLILAVTYHGKAPLSLTVVVPAFLIGACVLRVIHWLERAIDQLAIKTLSYSFMR